MSSDPKLPSDKDWRDLLPGGFGFDLAPFAVHPLDRERAERAVLLALTSGVSVDGIVSEARSYLQSQGGTANDFFEEELSRVCSFSESYSPTGRSNAAWLIFWNCPEDDVRRAVSNLVFALDPRVSEENVCKCLEQIYVAETYSDREKLYFSTRKKKNPYKAQASMTPAHRVKSFICGHNPWLEARYCKGIVVGEDPSGQSVVSWTQDSTDFD